MFVWECGLLLAHGQLSKKFQMAMLASFGYHRNDVFYEE
jgi:hypothetical protein